MPEKTDNIEIADILRDGFPDYLKKYGPLPEQHYKVVNALIKCRTAALGAHILKCNKCQKEEISYNSCRNRHCPKCQGKDANQWVTARLEELLPVPYYHVVLTVPHLLNPVALRNKKAFYNILFKAGSETLQELAENKKWLGAEIGAFAVLHTWGQNLMDHPHLHWVVPAGGLDKNRTKWKNAKRKKFLFPVKVISALFRGKFVAHFKTAVNSGDIKYFGDSEQNNQNIPFQSLVDKLYKSSWVAYIKAPFSGPQQVLNYLSRYTHRIAISNRRIVNYVNGKVSFRWKDYSDNNKWKIMTLDVIEFIRRFLLHVLPKGFVRIRYFGFLCNQTRAKIIKLCRTLLKKAVKKLSDELKPLLEQIRELSMERKCPSCQNGHLFFYRTIPFLPSG